MPFTETCGHRDVEELKGSRRQGHEGATQEEAAEVAERPLRT